jgi:SEC-C motif-containing protein
LKGKSLACPCGGGAYAVCCGRYLDSGVPAPDAQQLMRSRYSAYVLGREAYLLATWHASTRPRPPLLEEPVKWLGLEVKRHVQSGSRAVVEFVARYRSGGQGQRLHEVSNFVQEDGKWWYVDGSFPDKKK